MDCKSRKRCFFKIEGVKMEVKKELHSLSNFLDQVRPKPIREFDQIYMKTNDMISQAELTLPMLKGKRILFLGDGDGMSVLFTKLFEIENNPFGTMIS